MWIAMACLAGCWAGACCYLICRRVGQSADARLVALAHHDDVAVSLNLVLEMMVVAIRQGASIPHALDLVGSLIHGELGDGLTCAAKALSSGLQWQDAWLLASAAAGQGDGEKAGDASARHKAAELPNNGSDKRTSAEMLKIFEGALEDSWLYGISPISRLESTIEQLDARERALIERGSSKLSVRLLMPTALCFLPAFVLIGVLPSIGSFMS
ncbi:hypothetical protein [Bifidobacterium sp. ESL0790]|uniref:hypothetical protein n=1 Tax=Bifidobacterium sp. ESL0790 TaxID=2983233 RepID=UPI0023F994A6|nr:hypothetical protein [Bifidobacterium sp. ESL0790]WEV72693.1 hypothetical protein OZY47_01540 [Bifidobacterium sp. ESL0790]